MKEVQQNIYAYVIVIVFQKTHKLVLKHRSFVMQYKYYVQNTPFLLTTTELKK